MSLEPPPKRRRVEAKSEEPYKWQQSEDVVPSTFDVLPHLVSLCTKMPLSLANLIYAYLHDFYIRNDRVYFWFPNVKLEFNCLNLQNLYTFDVSPPTTIVPTYGNVRFKCQNCQFPMLRRKAEINKPCPKCNCKTPYVFSDPSKSQTETRFALSDLFERGTMWKQVGKLGSEHVVDRNMVRDAIHVHDVFQNYARNQYALWEAGSIGWRVWSVPVAWARAISVRTFVDSTSMEIEGSAPDCYRNHSCGCGDSFEFDVEAHKLELFVDKRQPYLERHQLREWFPNAYTTGLKQVSLSDVGGSDPEHAQKRIVTEPNYKWHFGDDFLHCEYGYDGKTNPLPSISNSLASDGTFVSRS